MIHGNLKIINGDCMELMKNYSDNYFDLAIVDPPYGIDKKIRTSSKLIKGNKFAKLYSKKRWDKKRPQKHYFDELIRVSKNQIICGGNYFAENLPVSRGWIFWDKQGEGMSSVNNELMWTSFDICIKTFSRCHGLDKGFMAKGSNKVIHPTQKNIKLYDWILINYATKEDKILDTHLGSGSSAIAAFYYGCKEFVGMEIDEDYYNDSIKRIKQHTAQMKLL